jgi:hypothetical protein
MVSQLSDDRCQQCHRYIPDTKAFYCPQCRRMMRGRCDIAELLRDYTDAEHAPQDRSVPHFETVLEYPKGFRRDR